MIKSKFAILTHIMTLLASFPDEWLSSSFIAASLNINSVLVRKELAELINRGLVESKEGKNGGTRLLKPATEIRLSDLFLMAKGDDHVLAYSKNTPNPQCPVGQKINQNLDSIYQEMDLKLEQYLAQTTLEDFRKQF